jgi:hypothetical protein
MKRIWMLSASCLFFFLPSAHGQLGLYAGFSAANTNAANEPWLYGATFGGYYNVLKLPVINLGVDGQAAILHGSGSSSSQKIINGLVGPRAEFHLPLIPLKPYLEGHLGGSNIQVGQGFARTDKTVFSYGFAAGADLTVFPRLDWRVAEYSYTRSEVGDGVDQSTLTTGLVLRLPVP